VTGLSSKTPRHGSAKDKHKDRIGPSFDLALLVDEEAPEPRRQGEWRRLFRHFDPRLRSYFGQRVADGDELDDLVAELWRRVFLYVGRLKSANALWPWMIQIGVNLMRDLGSQGVRREGRRVSLDELTAAELQDMVVPRVVDRPDTGPHGEHLKGILKTLSAVDRELLELYAIDELTHAEIATRLNLPGAAASRKRLQRLRSYVLDRLRKTAGGNNVHEGHAQGGET
jgi:RNA polymerase sigma factor (sigma-70 family)